MGDQTRTVRFRSCRPAPIPYCRDAHLAHAHSPRRTLRLCEARARTRRDVRRLAHRVSSGTILDDAPRRGTVHRPRRVRVTRVTDLLPRLVVFFLIHAVLLFFCSFFCSFFLLFFLLFFFFSFFSFFSFFQSYSRDSSGISKRADYSPNKLRYFGYFVI